MATTTKPMTAKTALAEARRRWGRLAAVRERKDAPTAAGRRAASAVCKLNRATRGVLSREAVLDAMHMALTYRCSVGHVAMGVFFHVEGQGDTWEEAFAAADKRS